jgi:hypothetical protein
VLHDEQILTSKIIVDDPIGLADYAHGKIELLVKIGRSRAVR